MIKSWMLILMLTSLNYFSQNEVKKEYIILANGEKIDAQIKKVRPKYLVAKVGPVDKEYKADMVKSFYSKDYNTVFESHKIGRRKKSRLLGVFRDGEVIAFCELKNMEATSGGSQYGTSFSGPGNVYQGGIGGGRGSETTGFWTLEGKTYFRHISENPSVLHEANKIEFYSVKAYECFPLMMKLLNGLSSLDLSWDIKNQTFRDLIVKYNNECEAKIRVRKEEEEKTK